MATFKDKLGRGWDVGITVAMLPKLRAAGFDVGRVGRDRDAMAVIDDPEKLGQVLWVLCEEQAEKRDIDPDEFAAGFDGPTVFAASDAILEALADFSQRPAVAAAMKKKLPDALRKVEAAAIREMEASIDRATTATTIPSGLTGGVGNSAGSPASTPPG